MVQWYFIYTLNGYDHPPGTAERALIGIRTENRNYVLKYK